MLGVRSERLQAAVEAVEAGWHATQESSLRRFDHAIMERRSE